MHSVSETNAAWAAGFFDGEGCVSLHLHTKRSGYTYPACALVLVQKDRRPLDHFHAIFGAKERIGVVTRTTWKRTYYRVTYSGARAAYVLSMIRPYLVLKADVADVALELLRDIASLTRQEREVGLSDARRQYRVALIEKAKYLNTGRWAAAETKSESTIQ